jgi:hypothetical protein
MAEQVTAPTTAAGRHPREQEAYDAGRLAGYEDAMREEAEAVAAYKSAIGDHVPSGYEDQTGYGQVSCSCGWDSSDKRGWEDHVLAAIEETE